MKLIHSALATGIIGIGALVMPADAHASTQCISNIKTIGVTHIQAQVGCHYYQIDKRKTLGESSEVWQRVISEHNLPFTASQAHSANCPKDPKSGFRNSYYCDSKYVSKTRYASKPQSPSYTYKETPQQYTPKKQATYTPRKTVASNNSCPPGTRHYRTRGLFGLGARDIGCMSPYEAEMVRAQQRRNTQQNIRDIQNSFRQPRMVHCDSTVMDNRISTMCF